MIEALEYLFKTVLQSLSSLNEVLQQSLKVKPKGGAGEQES